jgi:hypothetical protein
MLSFGNAEKRREAVRDVLPAYEYRIRKKFLLMVEPDVVEWDHDTKEYLPRLMPLKLMPGVNGVGEDRDPKLAIAHWTSKGRKVFYDGDHSLRVKGDPCPLLREGRYRTEFLARRGRTRLASPCYAWSWEGYERAARNVIMWGEDSDKRRRFQRHIAANVLPPLTNATRRYLYQLQLGVLRRARGNNGRSAAATVRLEFMEAHVADLLLDYKKATGNADAAAELQAGHAADSTPPDVDGEEVVEIPEEMLDE